MRVNREETIVSGIPHFENGGSPGWNNGSHFFTNTQRGGRAPSNTIDLLEMNYGTDFHSVRYVEIEVVK